MENDSECSIFTVASSNETSIALIRRLVKDSVVDQNASSVPWTITNKYYTADVKFVVHQLSSWASSEQVIQSPAILFVWIRGEPYREHIAKLSPLISQHEFEVALAIRLPQTIPSSITDNEDEQDIDAYLSSQGFEFVDVVDSDASLPDRSGIPGVPRIIDALSTIIWSSMVRQTPKWDMAAGLIGSMGKSADASSDNYDDLVRMVSQKVSGADKDRMRRELEELERWLDEDSAGAQFSDDAADPWSTAVSPGTASPTLSGFFESSRPTTPRAGFDDDFTAFVSASPSYSDDSLRCASPTSPPGRVSSLASTSFSSTFSFDSPSSGRSTPTFDDTSKDTSNLALGDQAFGVSYKSLGSVSDFGDLEKESHYQERVDKDEGDEDMPSRQEIAERRIFRTMPTSLSQSGDRPHQSDPSSFASEKVLSCGKQDQEDTESMAADLERFDLEGVLSALQGLKEEIAGMSDRERRKAAARVALGLVYGLDDQPHS